MGFEKFVPPRRQRPPQVSIKKTGTVTFDMSWVTAHGLDKVNHVILYFDPAHKLLGVRPAADAKEDGALRLSHRKRVSSVRARQLFEAYGLKLDRTAKFPVSFDPDQGMAVVSLEEVKRRRGPRKRVAAP